MPATVHWTGRTSLGFPFFSACGFAGEVWGDLKQRLGDNAALFQE
ncbi:hypothetical protein [Stutzerimonas nitrititolerans]|nr:hypothetical protein [Stutzerimonas nitrititolerans]